MIKTIFLKNQEYVHVISLVNGYNVDYKYVQIYGHKYIKKGKLQFIEHIIME